MIIKVYSFDVTDLTFEVVEDTILHSGFLYDGEDNGAIKITNNGTKDLPAGYLTSNLDNKLRCFIPLVSGLPAGQDTIEWVSLYGHYDAIEDFSMDLIYIPL